MSAIWFFDFISPYAYLQRAVLERRGLLDELTPCPVLFAGLLNHWGHVGPAEIPPKRRFTYQFVSWYARHHKIPLRMPRAHPFNPLPLLRFAALRPAWSAIADAFHYVWIDGKLPDDPDSWRSFLHRYDLIPDDLESSEVKQHIRNNTDFAIDNDVFGVPTILASGHVFWGVDATGMYTDFRRDGSPFDDDAIDRLPAAAERKR